MPTKTIVIADAVSEVRAVFGKVLEQIGYHVLPCGTEDELQILVRAAPDLVIMDVLDSEAGSVELAYEIAKRLKVLWVSDSVPAPPGCEALLKPMKPEDLRRKVREMLHNFDE